MLASLPTERLPADQPRVIFDEIHKYFQRRWLREHSARVLYEDLRDLEHVREVSMLELLLSHLPACVGYPLSVNSLSKLYKWRTKPSSTG